MQDIDEGNAAADEAKKKGKFCVLQLVHDVPVGLLASVHLGSFSVRMVPRYPQVEYYGCRSFSARAYVAKFHYDMPFTNQRMYPGTKEKQDNETSAAVAKTRANITSSANGTRGSTC